MPFPGAIVLITTDEQHRQTLTRYGARAISQA